MSQKSEVVSIYKPLGKSMGELVDSFRKEQGISTETPITYAGRLDPMAEGLVLLLVGDMVHKKDEYLGLSKEYEFECLFGFETDTYDILGLVSNSSTSQVDEFGCELEEVKKTAQGLVGKRTQEYPAYSSKPVQGKPLFMWAREGKIKEIVIPTHEIEIYSLDFLSSREVSGATLLKEIEEKISLVHGDFRQVSILLTWQKKLAPLSEGSFSISTFRARVSTGVYIRTLVREMGNILGTSATTFHIVRKKIGDYSI